MKSENNKITISYIANKSGVSRQTVSRVINNNGYVKLETRKKVEKVIKETNYKPNLYARNLAGAKKNKNIILSVKSDLSSNASMWLNMLINKIISLNKNENLTLIIEQFYTKEDFKKSLINTTTSFVDGVVIFYEEKNDSRIKMLNESKIPYIVYGKAYNDSDICVGLDNEQAVILAAEYLFSKKLENIIFLSALSTPVNIAREKAIVRAYEKNNISLSKLKIIKEVKTIEQVENIVEKIYLENKLPQAIFVSGDEKAIGALNVLNKLNIKIPEQISVMGFDNIPISKFLMPTLSTVDFDYNFIAETIINKLVNMIEGNKEESIFFKGNLVIRGSTK